MLIYTNHDIPLLPRLLLSFLHLSPRATLPTNLICLVLVLVITSLITVVERKLLAITQRRYGPDVNGYVGMAQILADGLKLILKSIYVTATRQHGTATHTHWIEYA